MTTPMQLTGVLTGSVEDAATTDPITAGGSVTNTISRGQNDEISISVPGTPVMVESAYGGILVTTGYGLLFFSPNALDAPSIGTWTYILNTDADSETVALGKGFSVSETFQLTYKTHDDDGNETGHYEANIVVTVTGKDDPIDGISFVNPVDETAAISIDENSSTGALVAKINIDDPDTMVDDSNGNGDLPGLAITATTYVDENGDTQSLTGDSPFGFDDDGNIVVAGALDYETISQYTLTITATDENGTPMTTEDGTAITTTAVINVGDVNDAPTLSVSYATGSAGTINENIGTDVAGITFTADDVDAGDSVTYAIKGGTGENIFTIDEDTGAISLASGQSLDYETTSSYTLNIAVSDKAGIESNPVSVTINVQDVNDAPTLSAPHASGTIDENVDAGTTVTGITFTADDVDAGDSVTYAIKGGTGENIFTIDADDGTISLASGQSLDYEATNSYTLNIAVNDKAGAESNPVSVTINVQDANDAPTLSADSALGTIDENVVAETPVTGIIFDRDDEDAGDSVTYAIKGGTGEDIFTIDADDGTISLASGQSLDYEATNSYTLDVVVRDEHGAESAEAATVTIEIGNKLEINNNVPYDDISMNENDAHANFTISVETRPFPPLPIVNITPSISIDDDADGVFDDHVDGLFKINSDGELTLTRPLDYETDQKTYVLEIRADVGDEFATTTLTINVADLDEAITSISYINPDDDEDSFVYVDEDSSVSVDENSPANEMVGKVVIGDPDAHNEIPEFEIIAISYVDENGDTQSFTGDNPFDVDDGGNIIVVGALDYEAIGQYTLTVAATDATDTTVTRGVAVNVNNKIEITPYDIIMDENDVTESFTLSIETRPLPFFPSVNYTPNVAIIGGRDDLFNINRDGEITLKSALDYETDQNHELTIRVDINDEHVIKTLTINVEDVNEAPTLSASDASGTIDENVDLGTAVTSITFTADDVDVGDNLTYHIKGGTGATVFAINEQTGAISLASGQSLNHEGIDSYTLDIAVRDPDELESDPVEVTVNVEDVYEPPTIRGGIDAIIAENEAVADLGIITVGGDIVTSLEEDDFKITGEYSEKFRVAENANGEFQLELTSALDFEAVRDNADDTEADFDLHITITDDESNSATQTINVEVTDINDNVPYLSSIDTNDNRIVERTATGSTRVGYSLSFKDDDAGTVFTKDSFKITGADGNIDTRFEMLFDGSHWDIYLRAGETLDYDNVADRSIPLTLTVSDGLNVSSEISLYVKTVRVAVGTEGNDVIKGGSGPENIYGLGGDDTIYGGAEDDWLYGNSGDNVLYGGAGDDYLFGGLGDETLYGGAGNDYIHGGRGDDTLYGGAGHDVLVGNRGEETLYGGAGLDRLVGQRGNDLFYLDIANAKVGNINSDVAIDFSPGGINGIDRILIEVSKTDKATIDGLATSQAKLNKLAELADIRWDKASVTLTYHDFNISLDTAGTVIYDKRGTSRTDDDIILMVLQDFNDDLTFEMFQIVVEDIITGTSRGETLSGTGRNSRIDGGSGNDTIYGGAGDDIIRGQNGHDTLYGGEDNDFLYGGNHNDVLYGEGGIDILRGNYGRDRFVLDIVNAGAPDVDIVADFSRISYHHRDAIRVDTPNGNETSFAALGLYVKQVANKVITGHETGENDVSKMDTIIYKIVGQADTASNRETDDVALMIIEDYTITDAHFATMVEVV